MRIWVSGPRIGPVHTELWSSGRRRRYGGKVLAAIFLPLALVPLALQFRYRPVDVIAVVLVALGVVGWRTSR